MSELGIFYPNIPSGVTTETLAGTIGNPFGSNQDDALRFFEKYINTDNLKGTLHFTLAPFGESEMNLVFIDSNGTPDTATSLSALFSGLIPTNESNMMGAIITYELHRTTTEDSWSGGAGMAIGMNIALGDPVVSMNLPYATETSLEIIEWGDSNE